jgi:hypothetical protein
MTGLGTNVGSSATGNSAGKRSDEARDWAGVFGDIGRFRATETVLSPVSDGKAAESQRLFARRQEPGIAQDRCSDLRTTPPKIGPV